MRRHTILLLLSSALMVGCMDQPTDVEVPVLAEDATSFDRQPLPGDRVAYRVSGGFVSTRHSWDFLWRSEWDIDAWVGRDGSVGGTAITTINYDPECAWCADFENVPLHQDVVCLSVDPSTRQAWLGLYMWIEDWGEGHIFIVQTRDLAPAAKSGMGLERSGRRDLLAYRSQDVEEAEDFCMQQPDLSTIPVPGLSPVAMFPIASGDVDIRIGERIH